MFPRWPSISLSCDWCMGESQPPSPSFPSGWHGCLFKLSSEPFFISTQYRCHMDLWWHWGSEGLMPIIVGSRDRRNNFYEFGQKWAILSMFSISHSHLLPRAESSLDGGGCFSCGPCTSDGNGNVCCTGCRPCWAMIMHRGYICT
jgi:hypothetical protein